MQRTKVPSVAACLSARRQPDFSGGYRVARGYAVMNRILPAPRSILEDGDAVLRYFQKANRSGYACVFEASCDGSSDFVESSGRECDDTRSGAAQCQTQQARHLRHGKRFGQARNQFLPVMLVQAILHRVPN